ncbi:hypothetical protein HYY69_06810 [Candidatus Woesearchaeota archaeon]|nr:hypothetical protein [Candidatus Woesearchaeota archaeon]
MVYSSIAEFNDDLAKSETFVRRIERIGRSLRQELSERRKLIETKFEIMYLGSTSLERLTAVVDPKAPDDRYQSDFDIGVITEDELDLEHKVRIVEHLLPTGSTFRTNGRVERRAITQKFPINMAILSVKEADHLPPIVYSRQYPDIPPVIRRDIRALRLYVMRNGLYGGFTRGFKGIALERLIIEQGNFESALDWLQTEAKANIVNSGKESYLENPINGSNLLGRLIPRVWRVLATSAEEYFQRSRVRSRPYDGLTWEEDNHSSYTFMFKTSKISDPDKCYRLVDKYLHRALQRVHKRLKSDLDITYDILVLPHLKDLQIFVSCTNLTREAQSVFNAEFYRRWNCLVKYDFK